MRRLRPTLRKLREMGNMLSGEQRDMMDTLMGPVGGDGSEEWCDKIGYSSFWEDTVPDGMVSAPTITVSVVDVDIASAGSGRSVVSHVYRSRYRTRTRASLRRCVTCFPDASVALT